MGVPKLLNPYKVGFLPFFPSPPSHQSNLLILNISAKSSRIFSKFWGKLPLGILPWLKQKNKQIYKQNKKSIFQSNFQILNISAKSSRIFTKFSVELSVGVPHWVKQKTNKSYKKQTNKQTNKHFLKSYISQPNQVGSSWNFQGTFLWVFQDD